MIKADKAPDAAAGPEDRFVARLTEAALEQRMREIQTQLSKLEILAEYPEDRQRISLSNANIRDSIFRDLPAELTKYLEKCVAVAFEFSANEAAGYSAVMQAGMALQQPAILLETPQRRKFQSYLESHPHLQASLSSVTHYTPSKWLLEQEMLSRKDPAGKAGRGAQFVPANWPRERGDVYDYAARQGLLGLCFSGGGVRSATFNLGILQALAELNLLKHFDYLSSVSGGGYIHQWFASWIKRSSGLEHVRKLLIPQPQDKCPPASPEPIRWLRRYASYLTPRSGLFSADTWLVAAVWFRNTLLNQIILFTLLGMVCALPHLFVIGFEPTNNLNLSHTYPSHPARWLMTGNIFFAILFLFVSIRIAVNFVRMRKNPGTADEPNLLTNSGVRMQLILPLLSCAVWLTFWLDTVTFTEHRDFTWIVIGCLFASIYLILAFSGGTLGCIRSRFIHNYAAGEKDRQTKVLIIAAVLACGAALASAGAATVLVPLICKASGWLSCLIGKITPPAPSTNSWLACLPRAVPIQHIDPWRVKVAVLPPLYLAVPYLGLILLSGFLGTDYPEARREWLARFRAWNLLFGVIWVIFVGTALLGPYAGSWLFQKNTFSAIVTFVGAHLTTLLAGGSSKSDGKPAPDKLFGLKPLDVLAWVASPIAILGLLVAVSSVVEKVGSMLQVALHTNWIAGSYAATGLILLGCLLVQATLGLRIDVNTFSMHAFYRNRLARCYLGATNPTRHPDPFTGFDNNGELSPVSPQEQSVHVRPVDDPDQNRKPLFIRNLLPTNWAPLPSYLPTSRENVKPYDGPFPIFCSTINLTFGQDLAWQERKGASFIFTPLYSGYHVGWTAARTQQHLRFNGFTETCRYTGPRGVALDTAVAVSGAAMNPNQGYNTLPAVAFLMTLFNVRLGWWIWNPRNMQQEERRWRLFPWVRITRPSPVCAMSSLIRELTGSVDDTSQFVLLTDGGHFENMGLYELVRRRCKFIVICDAEEDVEMHFSGISRAIRNCRIDFGAEIDLDLRPLEIQDSSFSQTHCVVGTIKYPPPNRRYAAPATEQGSDYTGTIVYIKSSLVGDEPGDLLGYKNQHAAFPQDPTSNQWFTESQFESYRRLGHHIGLTTFQPAVGRSEYSHSTIGDLFDSLFQIWYPPTPEMQAHFAEHSQRYEQLLTELRTRPELAGFAQALFSPLSDSTKAWQGNDKPAQAYAIQFANSLIDFMWTVYTNLQLAFPDNRTSPHAEGWIEMFSKWGDTLLLRQAWSHYSPTYPLEFRLFANDVLNIKRIT